MAAVGIALRSRGHRVTFFQVLDFRQVIVASGLEFRAIGIDKFPLGSMGKLDEILGKLSGIAGLKYSIRRSVDQAELFLKVLPKHLLEEGIEFLVIDDVELYAFTIADFLSIPYVTLSMALPVVIDDSVPPYFTSWSHRADSIGQLRNRLGYRFYLHLASPLSNLVDSYRDRWQLPARASRAARRSRLASISQLPQSFDFPRVALSRFHYTAPFSLRFPRQDVDFPWGELDGRPLVYASFGTVMSRPRELAMIAKAASDLGYQAVLTCGGTPVSALRGIHSEHIVVLRAPQLELLERAAVVVTHGGLNTVLEALAFGVPVLAIPFVNDQPGVAARLKWKGAGEVLHPRNISVSKLRRLLKRIVNDRTYRDRAAEVSDTIRTVDGAQRAADLIERVVG
jgi:zeaxanthin glucosyltransferase